MPFVKLDSGLLNSTLWVDKPARDVFVTCLLMAVPYELTEPEPQLHVDRLEETGWTVPPGWYGMVESAAAGILRNAIVERDEGLQALTKLGEPDPESRSADFEGRRLVRIDGGYLVLNFQKYRERDYGAADRMRRKRAREKAAATGSRGSQIDDRPTAGTQQPPAPQKAPEISTQNGAVQVVAAALEALGVRSVRPNNRNVTPNCDGSRSIVNTVSSVPSEHSHPPAGGLAAADIPTIGKPPKPAKPSGHVLRFAEFWEAWPPNERKHDKAKCCEHWAKHRLDEKADAILADMRAKRGTSKWSKDGGEFIEAPLTYLRGKRWEDGTELAVNGKPWYDTGPGIEAKGVELGLGKWDRALFEGSGGLHGEPWVTYAKRVFQKAGHTPT